MNENYYMHLGKQYENQKEICETNKFSRRKFSELVKNGSITKNIKAECSYGIQSKK